MDTGPLIVVAALVLLVGAGIAWGRDRSRLRLELAQAQARTEELRARLDSCVHDLEQVTRTFTSERGTYLITDAGLEKPQDRRQPNVPDRLVLSATLGEPLVKVVALGHGLARALSPESRNKIRFEMRREVRRSRKQRRREMKEAWRHRRGEQRAEAGTEAA
jgi:hypothetical protein